MGSPSSVLTVGLGSWGSVNEVVTLGYGIGVVVIPEPPTVSIGGGGAVGGGGPITKSRRKKKKKPLFADFSPDPPFPREFIEAEYEEEGLLIASMEAWH